MQIPLLEEYANKKAKEDGYGKQNAWEPIIHTS